MGLIGARMTGSDDPWPNSTSRVSDSTSAIRLPAPVRRRAGLEPRRVGARLGSRRGRRNAASRAARWPNWAAWWSCRWWPTMAGPMRPPACASGSTSPQRHAENLLIFTDRRDARHTKPVVLGQAQQTRRNRQAQADATSARILRGQPVDLFASKLQAMVVELSELDADGPAAGPRSRAPHPGALDVDKTTKHFFTRYAEQHASLLDADPGHRRRARPPLVRLASSSTG